MGAAISDRSPIVLVVEDEPLLRIMAADIVEDAGFTPLEAADADEAMVILESRNDVRLVFTDIHMPGSCNGMGFAAVIRDRWPPIEIIITSGQLRDEDVDLPSRGVFVPKPYGHDSLIRLMQRMIA